MDTSKKDIIKTVYEQLKNRQINPAGTFDKAGRFYLKHSDLVSVRSPSRAWPYSQMLAGRTKKYVAAVAEKYNCSTVSELLSAV